MTPVDPNVTVPDGPVLCVVGWWPTEPDVTGIFIREHIQAIARYRPVIVIHVEVVKSPLPWPITQLNKSLEH